MVRTGSPTRRAATSYSHPGPREWTQAAAPPRAVSGGSAGVYNGRIYLAGGDDDSFPGNGVSGEVNVYDIASGTWLPNAEPMPAPVTNAGSVQVGRYLYVAGGWDRNAIEPPIKNNTTTQRLDLVDGTWSVGPTLTEAPADFAMTSTGSALYAIGGDATGGGFFDSSTTVRRLDLTQWPAGAWTTDPRPLPIPLAANAGYHAAGKLWSLGGATTGKSITDKTLSRRRNPAGVIGTEC